MRNRSGIPQPLWEIIKCGICVVLAVGISCAVCLRMTGIENAGLSSVFSRLDAVEQNIKNNSSDQENADDNTANPLYGKKIVYDGDSIAESRENNGGAYASAIAKLTGSTFENLATGGAHLSSDNEKHSVVDNLVNLPKDGDLYCFEGGINDYWANI